MRREGRRYLETRAPRKGTIIAAAICGVLGIFGYVGWFHIGQDWSFALVGVGWALLMLGSLLRDL
jgi:hypothetical protein